MKTAGFKFVSSFSIAGTVAALGLVAAMSIALAQQGTPEQQQACSGDAQRLCGQFIPDASKTGACLARAKRQLSPACHAVFSTPTHRPTHRAHHRHT
jgi:hypothetical protein